MVFCTFVLSQFCCRSSLVPSFLYDGRHRPTTPLFSYTRVKRPYRRGRKVCGSESQSVSPVVYRRPGRGRDLVRPLRSSPTFRTKWELSFLPIPICSARSGTLRPSVLPVGSYSETEGWPLPKERKTSNFDVSGAPLQLVPSQLSDRSLPSWKS